MTKKTAGRAVYWLRLFIFFVLTLTLALISLPTVAGALFAAGLVYAPCVKNSQTPAAYGFTWEDVTLQARAGGEFRGYFMPGSNGAVILIPPTGSAGRAGRLNQAVMLAEHGYSVFIFESRRCAGMGPLTLGYKEVDEVADALDYVLTRQDIHPERVGVYGFSTAGATAVMAAARLPGLQAVVAEGGYGDFLENALGRPKTQTLEAYYLYLFHLGMRLAYPLLTGLDLEKLSPVSVIGEIASRPILLIYGSREVSLGGGFAQKAAAGDNAELWVVEGAGHGNYQSVAPEAYETRIISFFDEALLPQADKE